MKFGLIGASGYIAERHFKAIKENGGELTHIYDVHNSAGAVDKYFPNAIYCDSEDDFFNSDTDYKVICTPNHLHYNHIIRASKTSKVICEKPICLNSEQIKTLPDNVNSILQLRYSPYINDLKDLKGIAYLNYHVIRGDWYNKSWKGDINKSGGIAFNIGIHLFDLLCYCYKNFYAYSIQVKTENRIKGTISFEHITIQFDLSIGDKQERKLIHESGEFNLTKGFTDLHELCYYEILKGRGFTPKHCRKSVLIAEMMRDF